MPGYLHSSIDYGAMAPNVTATLVQSHDLDIAILIDSDLVSCYNLVDYWRKLTG